jgi:hypothetical protein
MRDLISRASGMVVAATAAVVLAAGMVAGATGTAAAATTMTAVEAALPANAATDAFATPVEVSCASAGNCTAVGWYYDSSYFFRGLLLTETAGTWAPGTEAPVPANAAANPDVMLRSVSCGSAGNCTAIGQYSDKLG